MYPNIDELNSQKIPKNALFTQLNKKKFITQYPLFQGVIAPRV
jgi:hypothetical protein